LAKAGYGYTRTEIEFKAALAKLINVFGARGLTAKQMQRLLSEAANAMGEGGQVLRADKAYDRFPILPASLSDEGQAPHAESGPKGIDDVAQSKLAGEGQPPAAPLAYEDMPTSANQTWDGEGHLISAAEAISKVPISVSRPLTSQPSAGALTAARKVQTAAARTIWDQTIGGILTVGSSTKMDFVNFARKHTMAAYICNRFVREIAWTDEHKTTLREVASEKQVRAILDSGPAYLQALEAHHD
jgi:hypothetical protein